MRGADVADCATLVGAEPFFQDYGLGAAAVEQALRVALEEPRAHLFVAEHEGAVRGFAWFVRRGAFNRSGYLRLLAVGEKQRGWGRRLMAAVEAAHLSEGGIVLLASQHNAAARQFYTALGYREVGAIEDYVKPGVTECIFYKAS